LGGNGSHGGTRDLQRFEILEQTCNKTMRMKTTIGDGTSVAEWLHAVAEIANSLSSTMERLGEITAKGCFVIGRAEIEAWSEDSLKVD
jgi:hypothetical protein